MNLYRPNPGFERAFAHSEEAREYAYRKAQEGAQVARESAPVRTGTYRNSIHAEVVETSEGWQGQIVAGAPYAVFLEFGTSDTPTFATLRRAGEAIERSG